MAKQVQLLYQQMPGGIAKSVLGHAGRMISMLKIDRPGMSGLVQGGGWGQSQSLIQGNIVRVTQEI